MGTPIRLGRIAGIPIQIDFTFLLALQRSATEGRPTLRRRMV